jgi:uncharacterized protein DUF2510
MSDNTPAPGWYPSDGQMRYWDGTRWTEHTAPAGGAGPNVPAAGSGGPVNPGVPTRPNGNVDSPLWKRKRVIIPAAAVLVIIIAAIASGGGSSSDDTTPAADKTVQSAKPSESEKAKPVKTEEAKPTEKASEKKAADDKPKTDDGTKPSLVLPKQNGDWRLDQMQLKDDGLGDFGGVGRITYTGDDKEGGDNLFTVTVFSKDGDTILATLTGSANSVKPGQTVTAQFISGDEYKAGKYAFTFQNDL